VHTYYSFPKYNNIDMGILKKAVVINSALNKEAAISVLRSNVELFKRDDSDYMFEGRIYDDGNFSIYPTFDYNTGNQVRPSITGSISESVDSITKIEITFDLPKSLKVLFCFLLVFNMMVCVVLYLNLYPFLKIKWYILPPFIIFFYLFAYIIYSYKVEQSLKILKQVLR
jgi:hypothetical protein